MIIMNEPSILVLTSEESVNAHSRNLVNISLSSTDLILSPIVKIKCLKQEENH